MATDLSITNKKAVISVNSVITEVYDIDGNTPIIDLVGASFTFTKPKRKTFLWADFDTYNGEGSILFPDFINDLINN